MNRKLLIIFIFLFGLVLFFLSRSWVPAGNILGGHDSGLSLNALDFFRKRLFAWDNSINFGIDNSAYFGSITLHGLDLVLATLGGTSFAGNTLNVFFWLFLIFISSVLLSLELKKYFGKVFTFILPTFLVINFYIFQSVFILERAKYGVYVGTLLTLTLLLRLERKKTGVFLSSLLIALIFVVFNGGSWLGLPLFGGLIVIVFTFLGVQFIFSIKRKSFENLRRTFFTLFLALIFLFGLSTYSWLPYISSFVKSDAATLSDSGTVSGNLSWLDNMSQGTSILNLIRLQGTPDWYASSNKANLEHQYADLYINSNFLIAVSFVFPALALFALLPISKEKDSNKRFVGLFFVMLSFVSLIFAAGSHPPTGEIYKFLFTKIPGFIIFRSPYFKFGYSFILGWSVLIGISLSYFLRKRSGIILVLAVIAINGFVFAYYSPVLRTGKLFNWKNDFSTVFKMPSYVNDYIDWGEKNTMDGKTLLLPPNNDEWKSDGYNFGYWSLTSLLSTDSNIPVVSNDSSLNQNESTWINAVYKTVEDGNEDSFLFLTNKLNIKYILVREDVLSLGKWSAPPDFHIYEDSLNKFRSVTLEKKFDKWVVYKIQTSKSTDFSVINNITTLNISDFGYLGELYPFATAFTYANTNNTIRVLKCSSCLLEDAVNPKSGFVLQDTRILPNSILYKFKQMKRNYDISHLGGDVNKNIDFYLGDIFSLTGEFKTFIRYPIGDADGQIILANLSEDVNLISRLVDSKKGSSMDYELAGKIYKYAKPLSSQISTYLRSYPEASSSMREVLQNLQWNINSLNNHFLSLWNNMFDSLNVRSYGFDVLADGSYSFLINKNTESALPEKVVVEKNGDTQFVSFEDTGNGWYTSSKLNFVRGHYVITIYLPTLLNVLSVPTQTNLNNAYNGDLVCLGGDIQNFSSSRSYIVKMFSSAPDLVSLFYKENKSTLPSDFIPQKNTLDPYTTENQNFISYFYNSNISATDSSIYACGSKSGIDAIQSLSVQELVTPQVILRTNTETTAVPDVVINYSKISPVDYTINIKNITQESVLRFNQRYDPRWHIMVDGDNSKTIDGTHFTIDGYANGWIIQKSTDLRLKIEYSPQNKFNIGLVISFCVFCLLSIVFFVKFILRHK